MFFLAYQPFDLSLYISIFVLRSYLSCWSDGLYVRKIYHHI